MLFGVAPCHKCSSIRACNNLEFFKFFLLLNKCSLRVVSPRGVSNPPIGCPFDNLSAHRAGGFCRKPLFRAPVADSVTTFEFFTPLGVVADWTLLFALMYSTKIPILLGVVTLGSAFLDSLAYGIRLSHRELNPTALHLTFGTLSDRFFYIQPLDEYSI